jgi:hypothetical protein
MQHLRGFQMKLILTFQDDVIEILKQIQKTKPNFTLTEIACELIKSVKLEVLNEPNKN